LYPTGKSHDEAVVKQLHEVLNDPATQRALSPEAFKSALAFVTRKGHMYRPHVRAFFVRMEVLNMPMDTEVFNMLAESAVKGRDLRSFSTVIRLMINRGFQPDLYTWILFLRLIKSEEVKRYILHAMNHRGLLDRPTAIRQIAREMAPQDIDRALQQGKDLESFLSHQEGLYGPGWLSIGAANKIVDFLGRYGKFDMCADFVDIMATTEVARPDVVTLNTILTHCKVQNDLHRAVDFLSRFERQLASPVTPNAITYHLLSELGWRHKLPHVTGIIWRYSCLVNQTSNRMRFRAAKLLTGLKKPGLSLESSPSITDLSGTAETTSSSPRPTDAVDIISEQPHHLKRFLAAELEHGCGEAINSQNMAGYDAVHQITQWYRRQGRQWEPAVALSELLREAMARDAQLHRDLREGREAILQPLVLPRKRRRYRGRRLPETRTTDANGDGNTGKELDNMA
jgi:hypothetical protein